MKVKPIVYKKGGGSKESPNVIAFVPGESAPRFCPSKLSVSPAVAAILDPDDEPETLAFRAVSSAVRHSQGDWGALGESARKRNERVLGQPGRQVTSLFHSEDKTPYVVTTLFVNDEEAETYLMTPEEHRQLFGEDDFEEALH